MVLVLVVMVVTAVSDRNSFWWKNNIRLFSFSDLKFKRLNIRATFQSWIFFSACIMRFRRQNSIILSLNEVKTNKNRGVKSIAQTNGNMQPPKFIRNGTSMKKTVALIGRYLFDYSFALVHFVQKRFAIEFNTVFLLIKQLVVLK